MNCGTKMNFEVNENSDCDVWFYQGFLPIFFKITSQNKKLLFAIQWLKISFRLEITSWIIFP